DHAREGRRVVLLVDGADPLQADLHLLDERLVVVAGKDEVVRSLVEAPARAARDLGLELAALFGARVVAGRGLVELLDHDRLQGLRDAREGALERAPPLAPRPDADEG